jgi:hypothetical protein
MDLVVGVVRVPHQPSTKWWILLAALLAGLISWWQHRGDLERLSRTPTRPPPVEESERVEIEFEVLTD